ncbi:MAG TPA: UDP-N-acetylmuramate dehydrogenase [Rhodocyclaceae bacterium]|nr:UDP-N-acetylmuramate dehydrogenase [Rhodocyclaceae bacterium]
MALPGNATRYVYLDDVRQLPALVGESPRFILGGGSNLVLSGDVEGLLIHVGLRGKRLTGEDADAWYVTAAAGENWHDFVQWTLVQGWPGLENLSLIPGTVGAAPIQNIGAYGLEIGERLQQVTAFDFATGSIRHFSAPECRFGYRDSLFKQEGWNLSGRMLITEVTFRLPKAWVPNLRYADIGAALAAQQIDTPDAREIAAAIIAIRRSKLPDPTVLPNAGSFFHNPIVDAEVAHALASRFPGLPTYAQADGRVKLAAGWLIEQCGWKGRRLGPVGMYERQALVLVNHGGATGADVRALMLAVQNDVAERFGVRLLPEPVFVGS